MRYRVGLVKTIIGIAILFSVAAEGREEVVTPEEMLEIESKIALPPDPGPDGDLLLVGYDVDGDGIRDDVQRYIEFKYWDQPKLKVVYYDFARANLKLLAAADKDRETILQYSAEAIRISKCISALNERNGERNLKKEEEDVEIKILNTIERVKEFFRANAKLSGTRSYYESPDTWFKYCNKYGFHE